MTEITKKKHLSNDGRETRGGYVPSFENYLREKFEPNFIFFYSIISFHSQMKRLYTIEMFYLFVPLKFGNPSTQRRQGILILLNFRILRVLIQIDRSIIQLSLIDKKRYLKINYLVLK